MDHIASKVSPFRVVDLEEEIRPFQYQGEESGLLLEWASTVTPIRVFSMCLERVVRRSTVLCVRSVQGKHPG